MEINKKKEVIRTLKYVLSNLARRLPLQAWLTNGVLIENSTFDFASFGWKSLGFDAAIGTIICMLLNFGLEFPYQRFVVFGKSIELI